MPFFSSTAHGPMTAALVPSKPVSHADVNASGCDIGIYLGPASNGQTIDLVTVHDANQYGVYADQAQNVTIDHTSVWAMGNHDGSGHLAPDGVQTGIGLYFSGASGSVDHTALFLYQKNGTAFNCLWNADSRTQEAISDGASNPLRPPTRTFRYDGSTLVHVYVMVEPD